jgi:rhodanese-related sulfurtransferase
MLASEIVSGARPGPTAAAVADKADADATLALGILAEARTQARRDGLDYGGQVTPEQAWTLFSTGAAVIVDVRTAEERKFVGYVPETLHVAWATGLAMTKNPSFLRELEAAASKDKVILFLCRSGKRSHSAAQLAANAGYRHALNVREGFEGDLDQCQHRNRSNGWRFRDLPWTQD